MSGNKQLAVRIDDDLLAAIDRKRLEIGNAGGQIPTRSDVVRIALEQYLKAAGCAEETKKSE